jgi:ElaB/YqjD/DUF883 family membrane-anchored ribosome-binding protein
METTEKEAGSVKADLSHLRHDIAESGAKVAKRVSEAIKKNPVKSAAIGTGVAFGLGALSTKLMKKKSNASH